MNFSIGSKTVALWLLVGATFVGQSTACPPVISAIQKEASHLKASIPSKANDYISGVETTGAFDRRVIAGKDLNSLLTLQWWLPDNVVLKFQEILKSTTVSFSTFNLVVSDGEGALSGFIGAARKLGSNSFELGFATVNAVGQLHHKQSCGRNPHCASGTSDCYWLCQDRGFTTSELEIITTTLRANMYKYMLSKNLVALGGDVEKVFAGAVSKLPATKRSLPSNSIIGSAGLARLYETAVMHKILGMDVDYANHFVKTLPYRFDFPDPPSYEKSFESFLSRFSNAISTNNGSGAKIDGHWNNMEVLAYKKPISGSTNGNMIFLSIFVRWDTATQKSDWFIMNVNANVVLASAGDNLKVVKSCPSLDSGFVFISDSSANKCAQEVGGLPSGVTEAEMETVVEVFEVFAMEQFKQLSEGVGYYSRLAMLGSSGSAPGAASGVLQIMAGIAAVAVAAFYVVVGVNKLVKQGASKNGNYFSLSSIATTTTNTQSAYGAIETADEEKNLMTNEEFGSHTVTF